MKRPDGLPHPQTVGESYLAEILDELRGLRKSLGSEEERPKAPDTVTRVKENQPKKEGKNK